MESLKLVQVPCPLRPLTASAYHELGKVLWGQKRREDAQKAGTISDKQVAN